MSHEASYSFDHCYTTRYTFTSTGRRKIVKVVDFTYTGTRQIVTIGFGDLRSDGSVDDEANSNNGDIRKVLSTVIQILLDFASINKDAEIFFTGSTPERTRLYIRILKSYYPLFNRQFNINVLVNRGSDYIEQPFRPDAPGQIEAFFIKRIV
ncbi:DUF6934 family protein [Dinghuibacter silviterrae]|uniref:Uncharacterized protein n=1 Tax=Dinghuibacter silviterrae TaxID=1539049 RepID=A0A4R8DT84_9BACT|nr:hypothetical protein [Dinghuibacter silviterrae]TDX00627.1 hypothetical protein EDB95_1652 [Dinghuibacter silviterrae]